MAKGSTRNSSGARRSARYHRRMFRMFAPVVTIAPDKRKRSTTPSAKRSREYRERQANRIPGTRKKDPINFAPTPLTKSEMSLLSADRRFKHPGEDASPRQYFEAIGRLLARMVREGR